MFSSRDRQIMTAEKDPHTTPSRKKGLRILLPAALAAGLTLSLAGCKTAEERADEYYQSGLELLEQGDVDRAIVQFRNVFDIEGTHYEARKKLAETLLTRGDAKQAYSQYLRLAEQYPDDLETRIALSQIAFDQSQVTEFERHVTRAVELAPDDPQVKALDIARRYRDATAAQDNQTRNQIAEETEALIPSQPDNPLLLSILLDKAARDKDLDRADELTNHLLELQPDNRRRYQQRLALLLEQRDMPGLEQHLRTTIDRFPDDPDAKADLVRFLMSDNRPDDAEAYLRELADAAPADDPAPKVDLVRFVEMQRGVPAAQEELTKIIAAGGDPLIFQTLRAGFDFSDGKRDEAIAEIRKVLETVTEPSDRSRDVQAQLARMLNATGDQAGAGQLVDEILAQNPAHPAALKMQAGWNIDADKTDDAIMSLRGVLDQHPDDIEAMNLMANAYQRAGEPDLQRDYLTQAANAANNAPEQVLRLAQSLFQEGRYRPAEDALLPALRQQPDNIDLLHLLGRTYLAMPDMPRAEGVINRLRELGAQPGGERAKTMADELELNRLAGADGNEAAIGYLEELAGQADAGLGPRLELIRVRLASGDAASAKELAQKLAQEQPDNPAVRMTLAMTESASGDDAAARDILTRLVQDQPNDPRPYMMLMRLAVAEGDADGALATIDQALEAMPDNPELLWSKAGLAEGRGDVDAAIAIYDQLYAQNSDSIVIANNLASLLATWKSNDPAAVTRASTVARRLKDTDQPAFMDTYGWIQHLNGSSQAALPYLEGAAAGLPEDPMVQIHLGLVQDAVGKAEDAKAQLQKGLEMLPDGQEGPSITQARETLVRLENPGTQQPAESGTAPATDAAPTDAPAPPATTEPVATPDN